MSLDGFRLNSNANFISPQNLLVEQVQPLNEVGLDPTLASAEYNGYDVDYKADASQVDSDEEEFEQKDFHVGAGVYFDIDKGEDCEEEEEPKKKKFWFLPFSVNQSVMVDSNLVVSKANKESHGLFTYTPSEGELKGEELSDFELQQFQQLSNSIVKDLTNKTDLKYLPFVQYGDDMGKERENGVTESVLTLKTLVVLVLLNLVVQSL